MPSAERSVVIGSAVGLHARPASVLVQKVGESGQSVTIEDATGAQGDAASILAVLSMGIKHGDTVKITVSGDEAEPVADSLATLLASDLDA